MKHSLPTLRTSRLELRWLTEADADMMLAIWNDPEFVRHVGDRGIRSREEALEALESGALKHLREFGYGPYCMTAIGDDRPMGICGLFKRENLEDPDIGFGVLPEFRKHGYVLEAAQAVVAHARDHMNLERLCAIVSQDNIASVSLLEKLGMRLEGPIRMPGEDEDILLYGLELRTA